MNLGFTLPTRNHCRENNSEMAGTCRKEENTIPTELAITKELEYRRIVPAFHLRPDGNSNEKVIYVLHHYCITL